MRILHISSAVDFGGGEKHIVDLCRGLAERGHDVFLALRPTNKWQSRVDFLPPERIFHVSIRNSFGVFSAKRIGDFAKTNAVDIVHAHVASRLHTGQHRMHRFKEFAFHPDASRNVSVKTIQSFCIEEPDAGDRRFARRTDGS